MVSLAMFAFGLLPAPANARPTQPGGVLWSVDWSFDDHYFVVGGERTVRVFDAETGVEVTWRAPAVSEVAMSLKWHPRKNMLAVAGDTEVTGIYDISTGDKIPLTTNEGARGISWDATGDRLATAGNDGSTQIWQADGKLLHTTRPENGKSLTAIAWHPSKDILVSVGEFIAIHDGEGKITKQIAHRPNAKGFCLLLCVEWHPSGEFFVVGDYGNEDFDEPPALQFWSAEGRLLNEIVQKDGAEFRNIDWNHDGSLLATASDALRVWTKDGKLQDVGEFPELLWGVRWNRSGDKLLTSSLAGDATLWNSSAEILGPVSLVTKNAAPAHRTVSVATANSVRFDSGPLGFEFNVPAGWQLRHFGADPKRLTHLFAFFGPESGSMVFRVHEECVSLDELRDKTLQSDWRPIQRLEQLNLSENPHLKNSRQSFFKSDDIDARNIAVILALPTSRPGRPPPTNGYALIAFWSNENDTQRALSRLTEIAMSIEFDTPE